MRTSSFHVQKSAEANYLRARDLPRLLPLWPAELHDLTLDGRKRLVTRVHDALRRERRRGLAGDWCYDLARHRQLLIAYLAESASLKHATDSTTAGPVGLTQAVHL